MMLREWLNRWVKPPIDIFDYKTYGYKNRPDNKCWCGGGLIRFYSKGYSQCVDLESCGRKYATDDGMEIKHQR